jgi:hypothetical protein
MPCAAEIQHERVRRVEHQHGWLGADPQAGKLAAAATFLLVVGAQVQNLLSHHILPLDYSTLPPAAAAERAACTLLLLVPPLSCACSILQQCPAAHSAAAQWLHPVDKLWGTCYIFRCL